MNYYNIRNKSRKCTFRQAVCQGLASDMGLYMPETFPVIKNSMLRHLQQMELPEIAFEIGHGYIGNEIPATELADICQRAFNFPTIIRQLGERKYVLELFHGPTAAFKDYGARFMSQCFRYFTATDNKKTVVLVATSGDTGGAIANSFYGIDSIEVIILYPSGKVSDLQEKQLTTMGGNITALEVDGTFDDCQSMVKRAFAHPDRFKAINLTSANSINIARLIPQSFYYYYAASRINSAECCISVPSGNFGNLTGAMFAWKTGLPVENFIASTNINKVVPEYLETRDFRPRRSLHTISSAMDVGNPSNFERITELFNNNWENITSMLSGYWFTDEQTRDHMKTEYNRSGYTLDPHGSVGSLGIESYLNENQLSSGFFVETAHPAKFSDIVLEATGEEPSMPETLLAALGGTKKSVKISADYKEFDNFLGSIS